MKYLALLNTKYSTFISINMQLIASFTNKKKNPHTSTKWRALPKLKIPQNKEKKPTKASELIKTNQPHQNPQNGNKTQQSCHDKTTNL